MEFVNSMREALNNLRYAEPWIAANEDRKLCREYHALLLDLIPKFESFSTSPKKEYVERAEEALHLNKRLIEGMIALNDPTATLKEEPARKPTPGGAGSEQDPLKPPEIADYNSLEEYIPKIKRALFKRSQITERGEARITTRYGDYLYSALSDLNHICCWKNVPTRATFEPEWRGQDFEMCVHVVKTANKLREGSFVLRILEPWIVNKKVWEEYMTHYKTIRALGEEIEKLKDVPPDCWKKISEELAWYTMNIGKPIQLFEENEPRIRVDDADKSSEAGGGDDGDNGDNVDNQSDMPLQADDGMTQQDMATNTGEIPSENTPAGTDTDTDKMNVTERTDSTSGVKPTDDPASSRTCSVAGVAPEGASDGQVIYEARYCW